MFAWRNIPPRWLHAAFSHRCAPAQYTPPDTANGCSPTGPSRGAHSRARLSVAGQCSACCGRTSMTGTARATRDEARRRLAWTQEWLIEERFFTLSASCSGRASRSVAARQRPRRRRRSTYTGDPSPLAIGLFHGLVIWSGDILTIYALVSFALVMFGRQAPNER